MSYNSRSQKAKGKKRRIDAAARETMEVMEAVLNVNICRIIRSDPLNGAFSLKSRPDGVYRVMVSNSNRTIFTSCKSFSFPPRWNETFSRRQEFSPADSLYLEVVELESTVDPGSSTGNRVVGRAIVPLPQTAGVVVKRVYDLVCLEGLEKKISGSILLEMQLDFKTVCSRRQLLGFGNYRCH